MDQLVQGKIADSSLIGSEKVLTKRETCVRQLGVWSALIIASLAPFELLGAVCNAPMPAVYSESMLLKDMSATLQQVDVRLEQILNAGEQYKATKPGNVQDIARSTARYINFFNCVWLIANDVIIGTALGGFICDNKDVLAQLASNFIQAGRIT
ncbi:hypothetical protein RhiTH_000786 [Rhizoctonia solani]